MTKYKAILYDLDGTVLNTLDMNMYPLMKIIKEELDEDWTFEQVLKFASYPGMKVMEELNVKDPQKTYQRWVKYVNEYEEGVTLYDGMLDVFEAFDHQIIQAVVSAKTVKQYQIDFVSKGLERFIQEKVLEDDTKKHKPDPEPLLECLRRLNISASEAIYVGDTYSDYLAAKNAHMDFIYAMWNGIIDERIEDAYIFAKGPKDLLKILED